MFKPNISRFLSLFKRNTKNMHRPLYLIDILQNNKYNKHVIVTFDTNQPNVMISSFVAPCHTQRWIELAVLSATFIDGNQAREENTWRNNMDWL